MDKFSFDTIDDFDSHIELSIPNYQHIWELINSLSSYFITEGSVVYDLGCSTGIGLKLLAYKNKLDDVRYIGYDISPNMVKHAPQVENIHVQKADITDERITFPNASLILSIFTLQFLGADKKCKLLRKVYNSMNENSAFIVCEKAIMESGRFHDIFTFTYYDFKQNTFSKEDILQKQYDLRSIMKNNTDNELIYMLHEAGFTQIQPFFQSLQFKGLLCIK